MSLVIVPACAHIPPRASISVPVIPDFPCTVSINTREISFGLGVHSRLDGMIVCYGGDVKSSISLNVDPDQDSLLNNRAAFSFTSNKKNGNIEVKGEPLNITAVSGLQYSIVGIQFIIVPYVGEEDAEKILAYFRTVSVLMNSDVIIQAANGQLYTFPVSLLEIIPLGPQDNLKPYPSSKIK